MPYKFKLLEGTHRHKGVNLRPGASFVSSAALHKQNPERFELLREILEEAPPEDDPKLVNSDMDEEEDEEDEEEDEDEIGVDTDGDGDVDVTLDNLESLTVPKLEAYAEEQEIDLTGVTKKADIIAKIREALSA